MRFNYIRHKIQKYTKSQLLDYCFAFLFNNRNTEGSPLWDVFLLIKWTYLYAEDKFPYKTLDEKEFIKILGYIPQLTTTHLQKFITEKELIKFLGVHYHQQNYLRSQVYREVIASQYKLFIGIKHKQDLREVFHSKAGISVANFLQLVLSIALYTNSDRFDGTLRLDLIKVLKKIFGSTSVEKFILLLSIGQKDAITKIKDYEKSIKIYELQPLEQTFLTRYPFQIHESEIRIAHQALIYYIANYFVYDFLKKEHCFFGEEFGKRFEKYIELGLMEMKLEYLTETDLKKRLHKGGSPDFLITSYNIFVECKAIELQHASSVNPTDERLINALRESILKAYLQQLIPAANFLHCEEEYFAFIITYKEFFFRLKDIIKLMPEGKLPYPAMQVLPPENVFIIDIHTWHRIIQLVKERKINLLESMRKAKQENEDPTTRKMMFEMALPNESIKYNFSFLEEELKILNRPYGL